MVADAGRMPRYYAVKTALLDAIESLEPGSMLPTERALTDRFAASRATVRQALHELEVEGRVRRLQGSGTFVAPPKVVQRLQLTSYTQDARAHGLHPSSRILAVDTVGPSPEVARALKMTGRARVARIRRLRLADDEPMAIETLHLPARRVPAIRHHLHDGVSIYQLLAEHYDIRPASGEESVEAAFARPDESALLRTDVGAPHLLLTRRSWDADGHPIEYVQSIYRGDRYRFVTTLEPPRT